MDDLNNKLNKLSALSSTLKNNPDRPENYNNFLEFIQIYEELRVVVEQKKIEIRNIEQQIESYWRINNE